jgi:hypothetical protein
MAAAYRAGPTTRNHRAITITRKPIRAELTGSDTCTAGDTVARGATPVLALCRQLLAAGVHPATPIHAYRGDVLAVRVRSIAEAARLCVKVAGNGTGFCACRGRCRSVTGRSFDDGAS